MAHDGVKECFEANGFVVVPGVLSDEEVGALNEEAAAIGRGERGRVFGLDELEDGEPGSDVLTRVPGTRRGIMDVQEGGRLRERLVEDGFVVVPLCSTTTISRVGGA